jgi:Fe-Mn family superoxide dismutase
MAENEKYTLPDLPYGYKNLEPYISEKQLTLHHQKHHSAYVKGANAIIEKMENARKEGTDLDMKATLKELSFHAGGHILHSLFWKNIAPAENGGGGNPSGRIAEEIDAEFGSFERFKKEFSQAAVSVEGSGWASLFYDKKDGNLFIGQIEKHNLNLFPNFYILMVLDVWEHAYYLDYQNERNNSLKTLEYN